MSHMGNQLSKASMVIAWDIKRRNPDWSFRNCLGHAWRGLKKLQERMSKYGQD